MAKQQTKYNRDWENCRPWLKPTSTPYSAKCVAFKKKEIENSGLEQVESHSGLQTHIKRTDTSSQHKICISPSRNLTLSSAKEAQLSGPMQALRGGIIESLLHKAEYNPSFSSSSDDGERFQLMFPGHPAALNYQCSSTKTAYLLRYGISEFVFEELKQDAANTPYTIKFDEMTTNQVKKL